MVALGAGWQGYHTVFAVIAVVILIVLIILMSTRKPGPESPGNQAALDQEADPAEVEEPEGGGADK